jgi:hypothetical protein
MHQKQEIKELKISQNADHKKLFNSSNLKKNMLKI